jgi:small nuclear ribonucleoprotein (snRNP)-like protein
VKIYVRKEHGIRGFITGFVEAFDKHFNIALVECNEVWKRRKFKFSDNNVALLGPPQDCSRLLKSMGIRVPDIVAKSLDRKTVECSRKLSQVVIRGEDVVLVAEDKDAA